jgi:23S rRNA (pseudouridine1915-N3)-methyltransferase
MFIQLICVGTRPPAWVQEAYQDYSKRMPKEYQLKLIEIPTGKRNKGSNIAKLIEQEGELMLKAISPQDYVIALDQPGRAFDTPEFAVKLAQLSQKGQHLNFLIGGPDGLAKSCLARANESWSLSSLTFPHALVRVILAEQIYRAWSILARHPYHRN